MHKHARTSGTARRRVRTGKSGGLEYVDETNGLEAEDGRQLR